MEKGIIVLWFGAIVDIPSGFALCNGANGTPDLRDRFVVGAGSTYAVDATGGSTAHYHELETAPPGVVGEGAVFQKRTDAAPHLPPYYALAYIQRV